MKVLPKNMRNILKEPMGNLVQEEELIELLKKEKYVVSIGDMVTYTLLKNNIQPVFCVVDYNTHRGKVSEEVENLIKSFGKKVKVVKNPAGTISDDLWASIKHGYNKLLPGALRIEVIGEEDLASLPAIFFAPSVVRIIYGLPDKGVLVVRPNKENKEKTKQVIDKM